MEFVETGGSDREVAEALGVSELRPMTPWHSRPLARLARGLILLAGAMLGSVFVSGSTTWATLKETGEIHGPYERNMILANAGVVALSALAVFLACWRNQQTGAWWRVYQVLVAVVAAFLALMAFLAVCFGVIGDEPH